MLAYRDDGLPRYARNDESGRPAYFFSNEHFDSATVVKACSPGTLAMVL
jgi:hypothetical protein